MGMKELTAAREMMVDCQVRPSDVTALGIIEAMRLLPRERFMPKSRHSVAYAETQVELVPGRYELAPRICAKMLDALSIRPDDLVLVIGGGMGYVPAVIARLAAAVIVVEEDEALCKAAEGAFAALDIDTVMLERGPLVEGHEVQGPYDAIFINGGVGQVPEVLTRQLKQGGRMVLTKCQGAMGQCHLMYHANGEISSQYVFDSVTPVLPGFQGETGFQF